VANVLPLSERVKVIAHLVDGCSIRATTRLTGVAKGTILRLLLQVGIGCTLLHDKLVRSVQASMIEMDELYALIGKREKRKTSQDAEELGDAYTFVALCVVSKLIISHVTGKRDADNAQAFLYDLRDRVLGKPMLSSDGFSPYRFAVSLAFGPNGCDYGQVVKEYETNIERQQLAANRYTPGRVKSVSREAVYGNPDMDAINTSYVERSNLTFRMNMRRFTRLTNGHSKKLENHCMAVALHVMHYNYVRVHQTLRTTPAVAAGLASHPWSLTDLVEAALREAESDNDPDGPRGEHVEDKSAPSWATADDDAAEVELDAFDVRSGVAANDNAAPLLSLVRAE
jgi:IS1 family transposase